MYYVKRNTEALIYENRAKIYNKQKNITKNDLLRLEMGGRVSTKLRHG